MMAQQVVVGVKEAGAEVVLYSADAFSAGLMDAFGAVAFGCPSMGVEQLEETEFEPLFKSCKSKLKGKKIALFGSYGWGDGEWMRNWEEQCAADGASLVCNSVICNETPDDTANTACKLLGVALATV